MNQRLSQGIMVVISSPSGAGKTTITRMLLEKDKNLVLSVSATTRPKRPQETDGTDYYFVSKEKFLEMREKGEFLESAEVFGNFYGTPREYVFKNINGGKDVLFDIDWQGARALSHEKGAALASIFILPPSISELENRLRSRAQDSEETVRKRMAMAMGEISHWNEYDYIVVNDSNPALAADLIGRIINHARGFSPLEKDIEASLKANMSRAAEKLINETRKSS